MNRPSPRTLAALVTLAGAALLGPVAQAQIAPTPSPPAGVRLSLVPRYRLLPANGHGPLDVLVRLEGLGTPPSPRPALDLALVIDRSGSMRGEKLARVKEAGLALVRRLEARDRITLISYDDTVITHARRLAVDEEGRRILEGQIAGLAAGNTTALGPALREAIDQLADGRPGGEALRQVLLLSDGIANHGETRPEVIGAWAAEAEVDKAAQDQGASQAFVKQQKAKAWSTRK